MTHSGGKPHTNVGDKGQQYEVSFENGAGERQVLGWSSHLDGVQSMLNSIRLHPVWTNAQILDRDNKLLVSISEISP